MFFFFFFNDTATTEIYTLSLHDALPISTLPRPINDLGPLGFAQEGLSIAVFRYASTRPISARQCPHRLAWMLGPWRGRVVVTSWTDLPTPGIKLALGLPRPRVGHDPRFPRAGEIS